MTAKKTTEDVETTEVAEHVKLEPAVAYCDDYEAITGNKPEPTETVAKVVTSRKA